MSGFVFSIISGAQIAGLNLTYLLFLVRFGNRRQRHLVVIAASAFPSSIYAGLVAMAGSEWKLYLPALFMLLICNAVACRQFLKEDSGATNKDF